MQNSTRQSSVGLYLRAALFWLPLSVSTLFYAPWVILAVVFPLEWRYCLIRQWCAFNVHSLRLICGVRFQVYGKENIPAGPAVVLAKHQSTWETFALNIIFPRPLVWVLKRELLFIPFFGWAMAALKPIAINRAAGRAAVEQILTQGKAHLQRNFWVVVFPEGTRVKVGERRRYKSGGAILAAANHAPVIPVAHNAGWFWPRHSFLKWPGEISVHIGPCIDSQNKTAEQIIAAAETWIETKVAEISPPPNADSSNPNN